MSLNRFSKGAKGVTSLIAFSLVLFSSACSNGVKPAAKAKSATNSGFANVGNPGSGASGSCALDSVIVPPDSPTTTGADHYSACKVSGTHVTIQVQGFASNDSQICIYPMYRDVQQGTALFYPNLDMPGDWINQCVTSTGYSAVSAQFTINSAYPTPNFLRIVAKNKQLTFEGFFMGGPIEPIYAEGFLD